MKEKVTSASVALLVASPVTTAGLGTEEILSVYFNKKPHERVEPTVNGITVPTRLKLVRDDMSSMQKLMSLLTELATVAPAKSVDT